MRVDWERIVYTWRWVLDPATLPLQPTFRDSAKLWPHGMPCEADWMLVQWKVFQTLRAEGGEPLPLPMFSRLDLGGGAASDETADAYPIVGWPLGAGVVFPAASPIINTQLYGPEFAWQDLPRIDVVTLADSPGCGKCIPIPCDAQATLRLLSRWNGPPITAVLETMVTFWLRPRREIPCS